MDTNPPPLSHRAARNINIKLQDKRLTKNALAIAAGIPVTSFYRKLDNRPDQFTLKEIGDIAEALNVQFEELIKDVA